MHDQIIRDGIRYWVDEHGIIKWEVQDETVALARYMDRHEDDVCNAIEDLMREGYFAGAREEQ